ncbi:ATP-binding protein [Deltaproteobacteria bacterium TL4]
MQRYIQRFLEVSVREALQNNPVVALLGPRQCGKSTLARQILQGIDNIYLDLERPSDLLKLQEAEFYLSNQSQKLVCIDEIQKNPDLFPLLRSLVDEDRRAGRFLILGSASAELIRQSSESLAGRISYFELTPFLMTELATRVDLQQLWIHGGFPGSILALDPDTSFKWREDFIKTFLERDLAQFYNQPATAMRRFWMMLAHSHGQVSNYSKLGQSLDVSHTTVKRWLDVFEQTFMVRVLRPFEGNMKKRLVKSPKIYFRDSGILHTLLDIEDLNELMGHPVAGSSWEGFALENMINMLPRCKTFFYRTSSGEEIDLILERKGKKIGIEFKLSASPKLSRGLPASIEALGLEKVYVVAPIEGAFALSPKIRISSLLIAIHELRAIFD